MAKSKAKSPFAGRWRIIWMDQWDQDFVDEEVEGYFEFGPNGMGEFQFGYVRGQIDYRPTIRDGEHSVEFSWEGNDEMEPVMGRGWAVAKDDELNGTISFHQGDDSAFSVVERLPLDKQCGDCADRSPWSLIGPEVFQNNCFVSNSN